MPLSAQQRSDCGSGKTGIRESVYRYFIPTERERQLSRGFEDVGRHDLLPFIQSRLDVLMGYAVPNDQTLYHGVGLVALFGGYPGALCDRRTDSAKSQPDQFRLSQSPGASLQSLPYAGRCVFVVHGLNAAISGATAIHTGRYFYRGFCLECVFG
jgi:hypothetical protein